MFEKVMQKFGTRRFFVENRGTDARIFIIVGRREFDIWKCHDEYKVTQHEVKEKLHELSVHHAWVTKVQA